MSDRRDAPAWVELATRLLDAPLRAGVLGLERSVDLVRIGQGLARQTFDVALSVVRPSTASPAAATAPARPAATSVVAPAATATQIPKSSSSNAGVPSGAERYDAGFDAGANTPDKEDRSMCCDTNLSGDEVKVVQYSIVTVESTADDTQRIVVGSQEIAFSDDMTGEAFVTWVIALNGEKIREWEEETGCKVNYKYLRVCYCVQCRLQVEDTDCCLEQVDVLRQINVSINKQLGS